MSAGCEVEGPEPANAKWNPGVVHRREGIDAAPTQMEPRPHQAIVVRCGFDSASRGKELGASLSPNGKFTADGVRLDGTIQSIKTSVARY